MVRLSPELVTSRGQQLRYGDGVLTVQKCSGWFVCDWKAFVCGVALQDDWQG